MTPSKKGNLVRLIYTDPQLLKGYSDEYMELWDQLEDTYGADFWIVESEEHRLMFDVLEPMS